MMNFKTMDHGRFSEKGGGGGGKNTVLKTKMLVYKNLKSIRVDMLMSSSSVAVKQHSAVGGSESREKAS